MSTEGRPNYIYLWEDSSRGDYSCLKGKIKELDGLLSRGYYS